MREFSAAAWAAIEAKTTALERNQALASQFSGPCTIDFLDGSGEIIRTVSTDAWAAQQVAGGYRAVPGIYTDAAIGDGIPEVAVFRSGGTEVFRVDCSVNQGATYQLAGNIAAGIPIRRGDFAIGVLPRVSGGAVAPVVVAQPTVAGEAKVGALLVATPGQYSGNPAPTVTRQWIVGGAVLAGQTGLTYTVRAVDVGKSVGYRETVSNGIGAPVIANSNYLGPITATELQFVGPAIIEIEQGGTHAMSQYAAGGTPPYTYAYTGTLPAGVTQNPTTGQLSAVADAPLAESSDIDFHADDSSATQEPEPPAETAPVNVTLPSISGPPQVGQTLTANNGVWTGNPTPTFTRQWLRNGSPISGQTGANYVLVSADEGAAITLRISASNGVGSPVQATSAPTAPVLPAVTESAPVNTSPPYITGYEEVGTPLMAWPGEWLADPIPQFSYQWLSNGGLVPNETARTYVPPPERQGEEVKLRVVANNGIGTATAESNVTAPLAPKYPMDEPPQYLLDDRGNFSAPTSRESFSMGPTRVFWNAELEAKWPAYQEAFAARQKFGASGNPFWYDGNWTNALGAANSLADPYDTITGLQLHNLPEYIEFEATDLVERWRTDNRGAYIRQSGSGFTFTFSGRLGSRSPEIIITTPGGTQTVTGGYAACFNISTNSPMNTSERAQLSGNTRALLHWRDLVVPADMTGAKIRLYDLQYASSSQQTATLRLYETDIPKITNGFGPNPTREYGLAMEVGEANLDGHQDVFFAGDMRRSNFWNETSSDGQLVAGGSSRLSNRGSIATGRIPGLTANFIEQPDGTVALKTNFVHGLGRENRDLEGPSARWLAAKPYYDDPTFPLDPSTVETEMYFRLYARIEDDFWSTTNGVKWGVGFDLRIGYWHNGLWQQTTGNSGSPGTGIRKIRSLLNSDGTPRQGGGQWEYQGHSIRGHLLDSRPTGSRYQKYRPFAAMVSHNGPFIEGTPFGTEELLIGPNAVFEKGQWNCIEHHIKLNSVTGPYDEDGNGVAVADGIFEGWLNGVKVMERTDMVWRLHPDLGINTYWLETMHGGRWPPAPGEVMTYWYNNLVVAKRYIGPKALIT